MDFFDSGKLRGQYAEDVRRCRRREKQTKSGADKGQDKVSVKQLSNERAARSAQGETDGDFVLTLRRSETRAAPQCWYTRSTAAE